MPIWIRTRGASCASLRWSANDPNQGCRGDSPAAAARVQLEMPSARAETSAHVPFPLGLLQSPRGTGDPGQDPPLPPTRRDPLADRHPPICAPRSGNWTP